jgi:Protein of unknown function (DUF3563)
MKALLQSIANFFSMSFPSERELDERYLAESTDIYELEYRMHKLDSRRRNPQPYGPYALFVR